MNQGYYHHRRNAALSLDYQQRYGAIKHVQFDDLINAEHTKCKAITSTVEVEEKTRIIVDYTVVQIPAFGLLAAISKKK